MLEFQRENFLKHKIGILPAGEGNSVWFLPVCRKLTEESFIKKLPNKNLHFEFSVSFTMEKKAVTRESFDTLLNWLDPNREEAAEKYEKIRRRLIQIFWGRGCFEAEDLADATINRVIEKLPQLLGRYSGNQALYFYGVANNIHFEWLRKQKNIKRITAERVQQKTSENDLEYECLESCLKKLPRDDYQIITDYYREEKIAKIKNRRNLAERLGISINALQIKTSRIRTDLRSCLQNCLAGKNS